MEDSNEWECPNCGASDPHDAIELPDEHSYEDYDFEPEIEVDVTCQSIYFTFLDDNGDPGMAFDHNEFQRVMQHFNESEYTDG